MLISRHKVRGSTDFESRLIKYSRRGFQIVDEKFIWSKIDFSMLNGVIISLLLYPNPPIIGLRLLIAGALSEEVLRKVEIFQPPSFHDEGLPFGPKWTPELVVKAIEKRWNYRTEQKYKVTVIYDLATCGDLLMRYPPVDTVLPWYFGLEYCLGRKD